MENLVNLIIAGLATALGGAALTALFLFVRKIYFAYKSVIEMLRNEIIKIHEKYSKDASLTKYEQEEINKLYDLYKSLGGNGYAETLVMEIKRSINNV